MNALSLGAVLGWLLLVSPREDDAEWITMGRALLDQGKPAEALIVFEQAKELAPSDYAPRVWIVRSWLAQNRVNHCACPL